VTRYLDHVEISDSQSRALQASTLRLEVTDRIVAVRHIANTLIFLGLIGTVIGFIIALSAVDPNIAADAENVASVIATLIDGMSVALNTTLVGATLYLWLTVNYRVLTSGTVSLIAEVIYTGERRASA
jgi:biopolymer transport protein ExbB/TolQ